MRIKNTKELAEQLNAYFSFFGSVLLDIDIETSTCNLFQPHEDEPGIIPGISQWDIYYLPEVADDVREDILSQSVDVPEENARFALCSYDDEGTPFSPPALFSLFSGLTREVAKYLENDVWDMQAGNGQMKKLLRRR